MARIFSFLVLLITAVYAHDTHESETQDDVRSLQAAAKGSEVSAKGEPAEGGKEPAQEGTGGEGRAQQGDDQKVTKQFAGDYSKYMGSQSDASSQSGDWKKFLEQYARQTRSSQGSFEKEMDKYNGDQGADSIRRRYKEYIEQYSGDVSEYLRANQGKNGESAYEPDMHEYTQQATAASPSVFLAEEDASVGSKQAKAAAEVAELRTADGDASSRAQHHVEELKKMAAQTEANIKTNVADMTSSIESGARKEFHDQRKQLQQDWVAKLKALNATELATAKWDAIEKAFDAVADADNQLQNLDREMVKAMRHSYHERREAKHSHVQSLAHEARKASHEAKHLGRNVEDRQHSAGVREHVYEHERAHSERASEGLERQAEKAGEAAEEAIEREFEHVEDRLENRLDALREAAAQEHRARRQVQDKAKRAVVEARNAHHCTESQTQKASAANPTLLIELAATADDDGKGQAAAAAGDDQGKEAAAKEDDEAEPSKEEKPSKQEIARKKLDEATERTEGIVSELRQLATREHENVEQNAEDTVKAIIAKAQENVNEHRQKAENEWQKHLKVLSAESLAQATDEEVHKAVEAARHAQDKLHEVDHKQVDAEREAYDDMRRKQDNEVRMLVEQARKGADKMDELGRHLTDRDAHAGRQSEYLAREAEDAADKVEDALDKKFRLARELLDRHMREEEKAAKNDRHDRHESRHKAEEAVHAARRAARRAAEEARSEAAGAPPAAFLARAADAMTLLAEHLVALMRGYEE